MGLAPWLNNSTPPTSSPLTNSKEAQAMRYLVTLLPIPVLVVLTKLWPSLGQAANTGCPSCPFCP